MFNSDFKKVGELTLPSFTGTRVMMMPIVIGERYSLPFILRRYRTTAMRLFSMTDPAHLGQIGYLTVDERTVNAGSTHRRAGMHVDGGSAAAWGGGPSGPWANSTGMLTVSSYVGCRAWKQLFKGEVGEEGNCEHLFDELDSPGTILEAGSVYWLGGLCVHESLTQPEKINRQFVRLSLPSDAPWYEGYTENPLGVMPTGPILPRRIFMDEVA
jgi:hypothetical protein